MEDQEFYKEKAVEMTTDELIDYRNDHEPLLDLIGKQRVPFAIRHTVMFLKAVNDELADRWNKGNA